MRGLSGTLSSMSNYSYDSPRYVMHDTQRGSILEEVEESSSETDEEGSSEEESSSEEEEEGAKREEKTDRYASGKT